MSTHVPLPGWEDPRRVLKRHGLTPNRAFSQNFLVAPSVAAAIVTALQPRPGERVLEIGPGPGTLTAPLLRAGARITAVERERGMAALLRAEWGTLERLEIVEADAAGFRPSAWVEPADLPVAVLGNLPYAITGRILRGLVHHALEVSRAVIMLQREVRERLLATPATPEFGALTVFVQAAFHVEPVRLVPRRCFYPPPRVDSAVVALRPRAAPLASPDGAFQTVVRAAFDARRKTLRNALRRGAPAQRVEAVLQAASLDGRRRGETLSVGEFARLARHWEAHLRGA